MFPIRSSRFLFLGLALWFALFSTIRNLSVPDEGRYGDISRWMLQSGDWLVPRLNGLPFFHKPPLLHWLSGGLMEAFGVHVWVLRLVPVAAAMITLLAMFSFVKKHVNEQTAQWSVLVLATSLLFYGSSQYINHDLLVACWITVATFSMADFVLCKSYKSLFIAYAACGLGFLSKGLIGILIPGMVLLPWILATGAWRRIPAVLNPLGILLLLAIILPWPLLVEQHYPGFAHYFLIEQQFNRFASGGFNNKQPWFFYLLCLMVSFLPWLLLVKFKLASSHAKAVLGKPLYLLLLWWALSCIVFFSIPPSKLAGYILPATPPLAVLLAVALGQLSGANNKPGWIQRWGVVIFLALLAIFLLVSPGTNVYSRAQQQNMHLGVGLGIVLAAIVLALASLLYRQKIYVLQATLVAALCLCMSLTIAVRIFDKRNNTGQVDMQALLDAQSSVVFFHRYYYDVPFLLNTQQPVYLVDNWELVGADGTAMQLKDGTRFEPARKQYLMSDLQFQHMLVSGQKLVVFADKGNLDTLATASTQILRRRNFDVYVFNGR